MRLDPCNPEERGRYGHAFHVYRRAALIDASVGTSEHGLLREDGDVAQAIEVVGDRRTNRVVHTRSWIGIAGDDHSIGIGHRERLEQDATNHREQRDVCGNAYGQCQPGRDGEGFVSPQQPDADPQVRQHGIHVNRP